MIEWDIRVTPGGAGAERASILELGQSHLAVVAEAAGPGADQALRASVAQLETLRPDSRQAREPEFWCAALRDVDRALAAAGAAEVGAVVAALSFGSLAGASVGHSGAQLFSSRAFNDLTAAQQPTPLLGSAGARPVGFGPELCEGTLVLASRALFEGIDTQRIWSCAARSSVSEAVGLLANLVQPEVGHGSALIALRAR